MPSTDARGELVRAYVALGANLGDAESALRSAMLALAKLPEVSLRRCSGLYSSAPVDATGPDYLNAVVEIDTRLDPFSLLAQLQQLENLAGRERPYQNAPRTLDLDLLLYGDAQIYTAVLTVPHPRMFDRAFVLQPLAEIARELVTTAALDRVANQRIVRLGD
jgi:2-amino-4-hydroxy-6-hydroxymethyldihydropteridine diphosphokinase